MPEARLVLALHSHQPTGNTPEVFMEAHDRCYLPILEILHRFDKVMTSLHYSGPLMEWLEAHRPDTIALIRELASRGQVEIIGGGWQEPLLSIIPPRDALGQLRTMRYECARLFGQLPRGMWLAERVWEPDIPTLARDSGYEFTFVDDTHLIHAGVMEEPITGWWITERHGKSMALLPICRALRYAIPFQPPSSTLDLVCRGGTFTYGDDGEKFGLWPKTHEWVWERGWLEEFFATITRAQEDGRMRTALPSDILRTEPARGRIYPPTDSYREMGEWSLPVEAAQRLIDLRKALGNMEGQADPFLRGGIWSGFLARYPESNWMHKRMLRVSLKLADAEREASKVGFLPAQIMEARNDLYRSQTNCAYWHGLFGGLYLPHLRNALYRHMIRAENVLDTVSEGVRITRADLDCDGDEEILVETPHTTCVIAPCSGCVAELVHRPSLMNLTDTLARRPELYHSHRDDHRTDGANGNGIESIHDTDRSMDAELASKLVYDEHPRRAFQDILLAPGADPARLETGIDGVLVDLRTRGWECTTATREQDRAQVTVHRSVDLGLGTLDVVRRFTVLSTEARVTCTWELGWSSETPLEATLVTQININLLAGNAHDRSYEISDPPTQLEPAQRTLDSRGRVQRLACMALVDGHEGLCVSIEASPVCEMIRHPVQTVSQSESGYQLTFQGSCIMLCWPLRVESWTPWRARVSLSSTSLR